MVIYIIVLLGLINIYLSQVTIISPDELKKLIPCINCLIYRWNGCKFIKLRIYSLWNRYGIYNLKQRGKLYYDYINTEKDLACKPYFNLNTSSYPKPDVAKSPMVLIDRGNCSFVTKVHNVEKVYGRAAIIINNNDDDVRNIIMSDDGTGEDITIPAVLINKREGDLIKKFYLDNQNNTEILNKIILSINFDMV